MKSEVPISAIGTDPRWGEIWITNTTAQTGAIPSVNGNTFFAEISVATNQINTLRVAIPDRAGNMGYATTDIYAPPAGGSQASATAYAYNAAGCLVGITNIQQGTSNVELSLDWDERYRLKSVSVSSASSVVYQYDVLNRRVSRIAGVSPASVERYVYNGNQVVADLDGSGNLLRTYVWGQGIDNLLSFTDHTTSNTYYAIKDHQNTVLALVDASGSIVESYEYDAWGNILDVKDASGNSIANQQSAIGNRYTFQGREIDWATGLTYFRARWYDPKTGRWLSKDPVGISGGLNQYVFCGNNPVMFVDPMGLFGFDLGGFLADFSLVLVVAGAVLTGPAGIVAVATVSAFMIADEHTSVDPIDIPQDWKDALTEGCEDDCEDT